MSERLREIVTACLEGDCEEGALERLALRAKTSPSTLRKVLKEGYVPKAAITRRIVAACVKSAKEADTLARACLTEGRKTVA